MKFKKNIIVSCETIHRNKALASFWNMKDIIEMKITTRGTQSAMTNIINLHTYHVCHVDLLVAGVLVPDGQLL